MKSFKISDNGDLVLDQMVEGDEELIQCLKHLIYTRVGEWFLNENYGFERSVFEQKKPDEKEVTQALYDALYQEPRIQEIVIIDYQYNKIKRTLSLSFQVRTADGEVGGDIDVNFARV